MKILLVLFLIFSFNSSGQNYLKDHFGGRIGIYFNVGSHVNSIGLNVNAYYTDYFYQVNIGTSIALNQMSYGNRLNFIESRNSLGIILLAGKRNQSVDFEMDGLNHQTSAARFRGTRSGRRSRTSMATVFMKLQQTIRVAHRLKMIIVLLHLMPTRKILMAMTLVTCATTMWTVTESLTTWTTAS